MVTIQYFDGEKTIEAEVTEEVAAALKEFGREDENEKRNTKRRKDVSVEGMFDGTGWEPMDTTVDIEQQYEEKEEREMLADAVAALTDKRRKLVQLRYYEDMTECGIAEILGVSQQAVSQQLTTVYKELKKYFEKIEEQPCKTSFSCP